MKDLLKKCRKLEVGIYTKKINKDEYKIKVKEITNNLGYINKYILIYKNNIELYNINLSDNCYTNVTVNFDKENYNLFANFDDYKNELFNCRIKFYNKKLLYYVDNVTLTENSEKISNQILLKGKLLVQVTKSDYTYGYDLEKDIPLVLFKKKAAINGSKNFINDYYIVKYDENINNSIDDYNNKLENKMTEFSHSLDMNYLKDLSKEINIPYITEKIDITNFLNLVKYFKYFKEKLSIYDVGDLVNINSFVTELIENPRMANINSLKNYIYASDFTNVKDLTNIQRLLKEHKKEEIKRNKGLTKRKK